MKNSIEELNQTIEDLTAEIQDLRLEVSKLRKQNNKASCHRRNSSTCTTARDLFSIGDTVQITNNHKGLYGTVGTVVSVGKEFVHLEIPSLDTPIKRKFTNLCLLNSEEE